jgi:type I restriction enzyme S subunit
MEIVKLNKICDLKNGFAFKSKDYVDSSNTLSCRMSSIRPGGTFDLEHNQRFLPDNYAELYSDYLLNDGDIVIAMTDLAGDPKILGVPTIVNTKGKKLLQNQRVGKLVIKDKSKVYVPYLQYALNRPSNKSYYKKFAGGGLQINVGKKEILNNSVPLPPLPQQQKIANILDAADELRQNNKKLIAKYDELTQALFLDMFGDPVSNPKGWLVDILGNYCKKIQIGPFGSQLHKSDYVDEGIPLINPTNINSGIIEYLTSVKITNEKYNSLPNYHLNIGDIIMARRGDLSKIGIVDSVKSFCGTGSLYLRLNDNINSKFGYWLLSHHSTVDKLYEKAQGVTMANLNKKIIINLPLVIPPINLQNQFAERIDLIEEQKAIAQKGLEKSEALFNSLLQKAFKGELV